MGVGMFLKVFSDCCICFAILGAFPPVFPYSYPLLWPALLCGVAAGLAAFLQERGLRWLGRLCALLPLLSLLSAKEPMEMIILAPVLIYTGVVILGGRLQLEYYTFRRFFKGSLVLLGVLFLILTIIQSVEQSISADRVVYAAVTFRYTMVHLLCGIVLQRQLRLGLGSRDRGSIGQLTALMGGAAVAVFGFLAAEPLLRKGTVTVLSVIVGVVTYVLNRIILLISRMETAKGQELSQRPQENSPPTEVGTLSDYIQQTIEQQPEAEPSYWWVALVALVLLAVMVLMFLTFRKKSGQTRAPLVAGTVVAAEKEKIEPRRSNRARVRQLYREFLRQERRRGLVLQKDYTSADVLQRVSIDTDRSAAAELRSLYIRARYDEAGEVTREQVEAAKAALKRSRENRAV